MAKAKGTNKRADAKNQARKLLEKAQLERSEYIKQLATLKKQGIVSKRVDARTHKPTRYMLSKIKKYKDVAAGHAHAVPAKLVAPEIREKYIERGVIEERGGFFVVPKTQARQRAAVVKGHVALFEPLKNGEHRVIFLPYRAQDMNELVEILRDNQSEINQMKGKTEQFGFQLYGNNSRDGFPHASDLASYIMDNYSHILNSTRWSRDAVRGNGGLNFVMMRFKNTKGMPKATPYMGERISHKSNKPRYQESEYEAAVKRRYGAGKKARYRKKVESEEKRKARLEWQREYQRAKRKRKPEIEF